MSPAGARRPLSLAVVEDLRGRIVSGQIGPGDKLPSESELIARHGVSRTVVREAVSRLRAEGLVHTRRGSGSFALAPPGPRSTAGGARVARTLDQRCELLAFRAAVESEAAGLAAGRQTAAALAALDRALTAFDDAGTNPAAVMAADFEFHRTVAEASGNSYLVQAVAELGTAMIAMPRNRLATGEDDAEVLTRRLRQVAAEHRAVRDTIADGDPRAAAAAMRLHLASSRRRLVAEAGG